MYFLPRCYLAVWPLAGCNATIESLLDCDLSLGNGRLKEGVTLKAAVFN
jgi:hypothetical protein